MQAPADQATLRAALAQARAAAAFAAQAKAEADAVVEKLARLCEPCEPYSMVDTCAMAEVDLKVPCVKVLDDAKSARAHTGHDADALSGARFKGVACCPAPAPAAPKPTLYDEVQALSRAILAGDVRAIADARPEVILAQDGQNISALFRILACSTRCEAKVRLAMLDAWRGALDRAGYNASTIAEYINKPNDYGMVEVFALTYACMHASIPVETVQWLVSHGADVNAQNKESGLTALIALADKTSSRRDDNKDTLRVLTALQAAPGGLRLDLQTIDARTALDEAVASGKKKLETRLRELMGFL
jgi:hypothetical protein